MYPARHPAWPWWLALGLVLSGCGKSERCYRTELTAALLVNPGPTGRAEAVPDAPGSVRVEGCGRVDAMAVVYAHGFVCGCCDEPPTSVQQVDWDLDGDDAFETSGWFGQTRELSFEQVGTHRVQLRVEDSAGEVAEAFLEVEVLPEPCELDAGSVSATERQ